MSAAATQVCLLFALAVSYSDFRAPGSMWPQLLFQCCSFAFRRNELTAVNFDFEAAYLRPASWMFCCTGKRQ